MDALKGEALCVAWLDGVRKLYGDEIADDSIAHHHRGWYYVNLARRYKDGSVGVWPGAIPAIRRVRLAEMVTELERRSNT